MAKAPAKKAAVKAPAKAVVKAPPPAPEKRYSAAGLSKAGVEQVMHDVWHKRYGHGQKAWSASIKDKMVAACNGAKSIHEVKETLNKLADAAA